MVYEWFQNFTSGDLNTSDVVHSGNHIKATSPEIFKEIHDMVTGDKKLKESGISRAVHKMAAVIDRTKWNPRKSFKECLQLFRIILVISSLYTEDGYTSTGSGLKISWSTGLPVNWLHQKKTKTILSVRKVKVTAFGHCAGIILVDYSEKRKTITGAHCAS